MRAKKSELLIAGLRSPRLAVRYLRGQSPSEITLDEIARYLKNPSPVVVEAGAFDGVDTLRFAARWPEGTVHAFEPVPELMVRVREKTKDSPNVRLHELALVGEASVDHVTLHVSATGEPNASSSILEPGDHLSVFPEVDLAGSVTVPATTLDAWAESQGVTGVDLLWLDLQGAELIVLGQGKDLLRSTRVVHLEVSRRPLYEGSATWGEVRAFMKVQGFRQVLARVPFVMGNALFVRSGS